MLATSIEFESNIGNKKRFCSDIQNRYSLLINVIIFILFTSWLSLKLNIWQDEAYSLYTSSGDFVRAFKKAIFFEAQAPLYFLILTAWRNINDSIFFARIFSIICGALSLVVYYIFLKKNKFKTSINLLLLLIITSPVLINYSVEIRKYSLLLLLSMLLIYSYWFGYFKERNKKTQLVYILTSIVGCYTLYYFVILVASLSLGIYIKKDFKEIDKKYTFHLLIIFIFCLIMIIPLLKQLTLDIYKNDLTGKYIDLISYIKSSIEHFENLIVPFHLLHINRLLRWAIRIIFISPFIYSCINIIKNRRNKIDRETFLSIIVLIISIALMFLMITMFRHKIIYTRHYAFLYFPIIITYILILKEIKSKVIITSILLLFIIINVISLKERYSSLSKEGDFLHLADLLKEKEKENEEIFIFPNWAALPFSYHYKGINNIIQIPRNRSLEEYDFNESVINNKEEIERIFLLHNKNKYKWLILIPQKEQDGIKTNLELLLNFIAKHYLIKKQYIFYNNIKLLKIYQKYKINRCQN